MSKRTKFALFSFLLMLLLSTQWSTRNVFAAPIFDAGPTITPTSTPVTPTSTPTGTATTAPYPAAPTEDPQIATQNAQVETTPEGESNITERTGDASGAGAGSSVLGFLLCAGVFIVAGLAGLNIWAHRKP